MQSHKETREAFGSVFNIELKTKSDHLDLTLLVANYWEKLKKFEQKYSRFKSDSFLTTLNSKLNEWQVVDLQTFDLLKKSLELKSYTNGYFDVSVESILVKAGYDMSYSFMMKPEMVASTGNFQIKEPNMLRLTQKIEFGGFGKGLMLDYAKEVFNKLDEVFVNAGGDIYCKNYKHKILFENPFNNEQAIGWACFDEMFLASSSSSRRNWNGNSHLVNPVSNSLSDMGAVYIQGLEGIFVDAMSTALFVMGYEKAKEFLNRERSYEAMLIKMSGEVFVTKGFLVNFF